MCCMDLLEGGIQGEFKNDFKRLMGFEPMLWQRRLYHECFMAGSPPMALDLPTGLGKTSVMALWFLARRAGAILPRRLVYVVDRRAVVDQATEVALEIKARHDDLLISTLRGRYADNGDWLRDPGAESIVVGTVDMIGSRLLFEGYGVSRGMRPYHAGLLGVDALVVLDEAHLVPPFERLLGQISTSGAFRLGREDTIPRFQLLPLSATGRAREGNAFRLSEEDLGDEVVAGRLGARKRLRFVEPGEERLENRLSEEAWALAALSDLPTRILVYCNSRDIAEKTASDLRKRAKAAKTSACVELLVGRRRVRQRSIALDTLNRLGFISGTAPPEADAFVVATSAGEVGVDIDADHLVMDLVPLERMIQRLGRVNRLGLKDSDVIVVEDLDTKRPEEIQERVERCARVLRRLAKDEDGQIDASPGALVDLKHTFPTEVETASSPEPLYPALTRAVVDAWSMTSLPEHTGRPEVRPWLRGWVDDEPQTTLVWRRYLPVRPPAEGGPARNEEIEGFFRAAPPHLTEMAEVPAQDAVKWLRDRATKIRKDWDTLSAEDKDRTDDGGSDNEAPEGLPTLSVWRPVIFVLGRAGEVMRSYEIGELATPRGWPALKSTLEREFPGRMVVLDARLGGLSNDGVFDPKAIETVVTPNGDPEWEDEIGYRVRRVFPETGLDDGWVKPRLFDLRRDAEGMPLRQLRVEKRGDANTDENDRALSPRRAQRLDEHQDWVARRASRLVTALDLPEDMSHAIVLAARLHDEGKRAEVWQRAFNAPKDAAHAKTVGPLRPGVLSGYRHEFGSLDHAMKEDAFQALDDELKDLVLHLIAAHHGRARPVISTMNAEGPPTLIEARAREVAVRFARLQKRHGPWGLAWLEAILRAADQQASRELDEGSRENG